MNKEMNKDLFHGCGWAVLVAGLLWALIIVLFCY